MTSLGKGGVPSLSLKKKINMKSSKEGELVGEHDVLSVVLWSKHFIRHKGFTVEHNKVYQDNKNIILMENNGRGSISNRTKT